MEPTNVLSYARMYSLFNLQAGHTAGDSPTSNRIIVIRKNFQCVQIKKEIEYC
jgi:hypothetical protein